jgi:beta-phosphoglucomutase-like phosphatase (HAD superfamily)
MVEGRRAPLVIFDCDGVLVDSEPIANEVLAELLSEAGLPTTTLESMRRYTGRSLPGILAEVESQLGRPISLTGAADAGASEFIDAYRERVFAGFRAGLRPIDGVARALDSIARTPLRTCVASSSWPDRIELSLRLTGLFERLEGRLFSAIEVERGKPHPDLFLHAAQQMGALPGECVVVEDSVHGARAGVAADMRVLGFCSGGPGSDPEALAREGARVFGSMDELPGLISEILGSEAG